ncbi:hypothetical protein Csp2054_14210 [Curtobacterium sp. 'Ferrero']|uniref:hypothetical protein n=1 Tax=Curtobacterium sp. 'Ferrero' TaxID=2033654 RepID=UPI000BDAF929|nr:hypothetical protein [Curtobacterium sp. 'Ferrero']PCN46993.1 hypothetical protein Csp2054_14210 [Curtobacterium sp. 'Ferrero']
MSAESAFDELLVPVIAEALPDLLQAFADWNHPDAEALMKRADAVVTEAHLADLDPLNLSGMEDSERYVEDSKLAAAVAVQTLHAVAMHLNQTRRDQ